MINNKINILANTLGQMIADAEDHGIDSIQPMLTHEDVTLILKALNSYEDLYLPCKDIYRISCKECIHAPICEYGFPF